MSRSMRLRSVARCLASIFIGAMLIGAAQEVLAQSVPANPFAGSPPPALSPAQPFSSPGLSPAWDPYAVPGAATPQPALPPYGAPSPGQPGLGYPFQDWSMPQTKLIQNVSLRTAWLSGSGNGNEFGMTDVYLSTAMAFPFFYNMNTAPLVFTPGFNFHLLSGPGLPPPRDIRGAVYDAFGQLSWQPQFGERLGADLALSVGVYSDFQYVDTTSIRILGRGVGTWVFCPTLKGALGVVYLDRLDVKILPVVGFIWTPHSDARFELLFPQPKLAQRITNWGEKEIWGYIGGEYGGGQWSVEHSNGLHDEVNYNDLRIYIGIETHGINNRQAHFEVGYVFNREIIYRAGAPTFEPDDTVMLRGGFSF